jgi:short-subunit dehydrogenase
MANLADEVAVVTGASSGIGAALARALSRQGAKVALVARRLEKLNEVSGDCPGEVLVIAADLTNETDRKRIIQLTMDRWDRIDILVNNAGQGMYGHFISTTEADWRQIFEINLFSPVFLTQNILPIMQAQKKGLIINIASIGGLVAHSDKVTAYVASSKPPREHQKWLRLLKITEILWIPLKMLPAVSLNSWIQIDLWFFRHPNRRKPMKSSAISK